MLPPKAYFRAIFFFRNLFSFQKETPPWSNHILKYNGKSVCLVPFFKDELNHYFYNSNYQRPNDKNAFGIKFGPREAPKLENLYFYAFSGWGTSQSQKSILKEVFKSSLIYFLFYFFSLSKEIVSQKIYFPLYSLSLIHPG